MMKFNTCTCNNGAIDTCDFESKKVDMWPQNSIQVNVSMFGKGFHRGSKDRIVYIYSIAVLAGNWKGKNVLKSI